MVSMHFQLTRNISPFSPIITSREQTFSVSVWRNFTLVVHISRWKKWTVGIRSEIDTSSIKSIIVSGYIPLNLKHLLIPVIIRVEMRTSNKNGKGQLYTNSY